MNTPETKLQNMNFDPTAPFGPAPIDDFRITTEVPIKPLEIVDGDAFFEGAKLGSVITYPSMFNTQEIEIQIDQGLCIVVRNGLGFQVLREISVNVGTLYYDANGCILDEFDLLAGLDMIIRRLRRLLVSEGDYVHIIPELVPTSRAYWKEIIIPFQIRDPHHLYEDFFRHASHPEIGGPARSRPEGGFQLNDDNGSMQISFYRLDKQIGHILQNYEPITVPRVFRVVGSQHQNTKH
jgi:hypothetical protein